MNNARPQRKRALGVTLLLLIGFGFACDSNVVSSGPVVGLRIPHAIGAQWRYSVAYMEDLDTTFNSLPPEFDRTQLVLHKEAADTTWLTITDTTTLTGSGLPALVWEFSDRLEWGRFASVFKVSHTYVCGEECSGTYAY